MEIKQILEFNSFPAFLISLQNTNSSEITQFVVRCDQKLAKQAVCLAGVAEGHTSHNTDSAASWDLL